MPESSAIILIGNPNCGKTSLFNALSGAREKVGNWPGTTVEKKEGRFEDTGAVLIDLPGTYSLSPSSLDEEIACRCLLENRPGLVLVVLDALHLERGLPLLLQLRSLGLPLVSALNRVDAARRRGIEIDAATLEAVLGLPVVPTVATQPESLAPLRGRLVRALEQPGTGIAAPAVGLGRAQPWIAELADLPFRPPAGLDPQGFAALLLEDEDWAARLPLLAPEVSRIRAVVGRAREAFADTPLSDWMAEQRYAFARGLVRECQIWQPTRRQQRQFSDRLDRVLLHRYWGLPIFLLGMFLLFQAVFTLGHPAADAITAGVRALGQWLHTGMEHTGLPHWTALLVSEGVVPGVGCVLSFLPYIALLFLGISLFEDSGYLARAAWLSDRIMHMLGLHGKSFIPMLLGFGCNVPAILATRALEKHRDRIITILILPLVSCSARLPVYTLFAGAFFPRRAGLVVFGLYLLGLVLAVAAAKVAQLFLFRAPSPPLIIELPAYHAPALRLILRTVWLRSWMFVTKAGTVILPAVVLTWALASLPAGVAYSSHESYMGRVGSLIAPVFAPAGFGFWQAGVALLSGVFAKEIVVSSLGTLYGADPAGLGSVIAQVFTPASALAFMVWTLLYFPCLPAFAAIRQEAGWKWALVTAAYTLALGWVMAVLTYQIGILFLHP